MRKKGKTTNPGLIVQITQLFLAALGAVAIVIVSDGRALPKPGESGPGDFGSIVSRGSGDGL
jgi:hypothetical protein